jgi:hypothetical protein
VKQDEQVVSFRDNLVWVSSAFVHFPAESIWAKEGTPTHPLIIGRVFCCLLANFVIKTGRRRNELHGFRAAFLKLNSRFQIPELKMQRF